MAVEDLSRKYATSSELVRHVNRVLELEGKPNAPGNKLMILARMFRQEGRAGLLAITKELQNKLGRLPEPNPQTLALLSQPEAYSLRLNLHAIVIGASTPCIVYALSERVSDLGDLIADYDMGVASTLFNHAMIGDIEPVQELPEAKWRSMLAISKQDPTLASFFDPANRHAIPGNLLSIFDRNIFSRVNQTSGVTPNLVSMYQSLAAPLVN